MARWASQPEAHLAITTGGKVMNKLNITTDYRVQTTWTHDRHASAEQWLIVDNHSQHAPPVEQLKSDPTIHVITNDALQHAEQLRFAAGAKVSIMSESALDLVLERLDDPHMAYLIRTLKNKVA